MYIINVREMRKSTMERYDRPIRLYHLVIMAYLHFPFRPRSWQSERGDAERGRRTEFDGDKEREEQVTSEREKKSARWICRLKTGRARSERTFSISDSFFIYQEKKGLPRGTTHRFGALINASVKGVCDSSSFFSSTDRGIRAARSGSPAQL